uniref:Uncharacterized protein n=1 Tax=Oryza meridionalis TaxID=40149 RepID=A0A0E0DSY3_9ORYZ
MPSEGIVQIYNPVTNTFWDITQTGIYTGVDGCIRDWFLYSAMIYFTLQHLNNNGSQVVITTRIETVASLADADHEILWFYRSRKAGLFSV